MSRTNCPECGDAPHAGNCDVVERVIELVQNSDTERGGAEAVVAFVRADERAKCAERSAKIMSQLDSAIHLLDKKDLAGVRATLRALVSRLDREAAELLEEP